MTDKELVTTTVSRYVDLMRIKQAADRDAEIETQESELRIMLESMGIVVDNIKVRQPRAGRDSAADRLDNG